MVGGVSASPIPTGQGQNAYQQVQGRQSPAQVEQRDPREKEVQRREEPSAQAQETRAQSFNAPTEADKFEVSAANDASSAQESGSEGQRPGSLLNVLV
mgnify:CR=1 FL=1